MSDEVHKDPFKKDASDSEEDVFGADPFSKPAPPKPKAPPKATTQSDDDIFGDDPFSKPSTTATPKEPEKKPAPQEEKPKPAPQKSDEAAKAADRRRAEEERLLREEGSNSASAPFRFKVADPCMTVPDNAIDLAYWIYQVITKSTMPGWKKDSKVSRRFSDFLWLREELIHDHPGVIVPPLPEKTVMGQLEKIVLVNHNLLWFRQRALTKFLTAVGAHPVLHKSKVLQHFCELSEQHEFDSYKDSKKRENAEKSGGTVSSIVQAGKEGWFKMFGKKKHDDASASESDIPGEGPLETKKSYAKEMEETLSTAHTCLRRYIEQRSETAKAMQELSAFLTSTGELENRVDTVLGDDFKNSAKYTENLSKIQQEQSDKESLLVLETIGFYVGLYQSMKETIRKLQKMKLSMDTCKNDLANAENACRTATGEKAAKAETAKTEAQQRAKKAEEKYTAALDTFSEEWIRFHDAKKKDLKLVQKVFVDLQISYARQQEQLGHEPIQPAIFTE